MPGHHLHPHGGTPDARAPEPATDPETSDLPDHTMAEFAKRWDRTERNLRAILAVVALVCAIAAVVVLLVYSGRGYVEESGAARVAGVFVFAAILATLRALRPQGFRGQHFDELPWWRRFLHW
jgi:hypothetical protein